MPVIPTPAASLWKLGASSLQSSTVFCSPSQNHIETSGSACNSLQFAFPAQGGDCSRPYLSEGCGSSQRGCLQPSKHSSNSWSYQQRAGALVNFAHALHKKRPHLAGEDHRFPKPHPARTAAWILVTLLALAILGERDAEEWEEKNKQSSHALRRDTQEGLLF